MPLGIKISRVREIDAYVINMSVIGIDPRDRSTATRMGMVVRGGIGMTMFRRCCANIAIMLMADQHTRILIMPMRRANVGYRSIAIMSMFVA
jgi:hypothetical protein